MKMNVLLLEFLRSQRDYPYYDFEDEDFKDVPVSEFMAFVGRLIKEEN